MWPALIAAGASIVGGVLGKQGQESANETNMAIAQKQMDFQREMSNTSYQRGVKDMSAAGLNPMLAYTQGGASSPAGASTTVGNAGQFMGAGVSSAGQALVAAQTFQQIQESQARQEQIRALTAQTQSQTMDRNLNTAELAARIKQLESSSESLKATADNTQQAILGTIADSAAKHDTYQAMSKGGGFAADVAKRKSEAEIARMEAYKQGITKVPFEWASGIKGPVETGAKTFFEWMKDKYDQRPWKGLPGVWGY